MKFEEDFSEKVTCFRARINAARIAEWFMLR
jgi:hypothetical protein